MKNARFISVFDAKPKNNGWYAILYCWEVQEGFFPSAAHWNGDKFDSSLPVSNWVDKIFSIKEDAAKFALDNDPDW